MEADIKSVPLLAHRIKVPVTSILTNQRSSIPLALYQALNFRQFVCPEITSTVCMTPHKYPTKRNKLDSQGITCLIAIYFTRQITDTRYHITTCNKTKPPMANSHALLPLAEYGQKRDPALLHHGCIIHATSQVHKRHDG